MELIGILGAVLALAAIVLAYYYFFEPSTIDEEETAKLSDESPEERREAILERQRKIEDARAEEIADQYSEQ